jgi:GxxExxY protein
MIENQIGKKIIDAAISIHRKCGPGLLESVYEVILVHELKKRNLAADRQVQIPIKYEGICFEEGFRADIVVDGKVILELKTVDSIGDVHKKQLLTYLKLTGMKLGFLLNFNEALMKNGITRMVNGI